MTNRTSADLLTELRAQGYAVLPAPRVIEPHSGQLHLNGPYCIRLADVRDDDVAVKLLRACLQERGLLASASSSIAVPIQLAVASGIVRTGTQDGRDEQAYRLEIGANTIAITGNARPGLFYGVQTLIQLFESARARPLTLPRGIITDWPEFELRFVHWDTKHHQDRMETLKRFLDEMARFKLNAVSFELEDKFEYPSHPIIGAPGAFTSAQLQELARYGLERHIQIVPNVQAPAHLCYVLKHPEFAHLRCDGSNYQICMGEPEALKLIFEMYDDLCRATPGVEYFHVSTDEVYYAGICEKFRKPYNPVNRSLTFVDFVTKAHAFLRERGRRTIIWAEFPLLAEHVRLLPPDIIDGIIGGDQQFQAEEKQLGIRQLAYSSMQGEELLFPNHFEYCDQQGRRHTGRLAGAFAETLEGKASRGQPIGTFAAAWDDSGLHNETFWLGWAAMAQCGWTPGRTCVDQTVADFMAVFYGPDVHGMTELYRLLQDGARFFEHTWTQAPSKVRGPGYGYSREKRPVNRTDWTLSPPPLPELPGLEFAPSFRAQCEALLAQAPRHLADNERLQAGLHENIGKATRNSQNLEVFLSLARLQRHHICMLLGLAEVEGLLQHASAAEKSGKPAEAVRVLQQAQKQAEWIIDDLQRTSAELCRTWEKGRYPRNAPVGDKQFLHVMDDVKDHFADRRADLSYMTAPEESLELPKWCEALRRIISDYAAARGLKAEPA